MPVRLTSILARVMCVTAGIVCAYACWGTASEVWWPDAVSWARAGGWIAALAGAAAGLGLARIGWSPGRILLALPARGFAALAFVVALGTGIWAHHRIHKAVPDVPDELGYLHQARGFADGVLAPPSPPMSEFHYVSWGVHDRGRWYAVFPPGYGAILSIGVLLDAPGYVNPLLGALLALVLFALGRELLGGDGVGARVAVIVYLASWFRLMHAGSFMAHPTAALFTALAVLGVWRGVVTGRSPAWAAAAGASLGGLLATRPLNAVIVAAVLAPLVLVALARAPAVTLRRSLVALLALAPIVIAYLAYNRALTGSAMETPQERYMVLKEERGDCFRMGFGPGVGQCPITQNTHYGKSGFQPKDAKANTWRRVNALVGYSFGFAPLALLVPLSLVGGAWWAPRRRALMGAMILATAFAYALFFYHGVAYGARFYYESFPFAALLIGGCFVDGARLVRPGWLRAALGGAWPVLLLSGMVLAWPAVLKHAGQRGRTGNGKQLVPLRAPELADAVVFVDSMVIPAAVTEHPARLADNHPLVVKDLGDAANAGFMRLWPDRRPFRLVGDRVVPLSYAKDARVRHEGGALYPLEIASGGFGDRIGSDVAWKLPLSGTEALRFRAREPGASFAIPIWAPPEGAQGVRVAAVLNPEGAPGVEVRLDGAAIGAPLATRESTPRVATFDLPAAVAPGRHWLEFRLSQGGMLVMDYVELR